MTDYYQKHIDRVRSMVSNDLETMEDGYKVWWPLHGCGYVNATDLRIIAEYLDELNTDWNKQVMQDVGQR